MPQNLDAVKDRMSFPLRFILDGIQNLQERLYTGGGGRAMGNLYQCSQISPIFSRRYY